jgi:hypothetical protein
VQGKEPYRLLFTLHFLGIFILSEVEGFYNFAASLSPKTEKNNNKD